MEEQHIGYKFCLVISFVSDSSKQHWKQMLNTGFGDIVIEREAS
jgi:hypothetical protein